MPLPPCPRCPKGQLFYERPLPGDTGRFVCLQCGHQVEDGAPNTEPFDYDEEPEQPGRRRRGSCLPDHEGAIRQWLAEHGALFSDITFRLVLLRRDIGCYSEKHTQRALWALINAGEVIGRYELNPERLHESTWRGRLRAEVTA